MPKALAAGQIAGIAAGGCCALTRSYTTLAFWACAPVGSVPLKRTAEGHVEEIVLGNTSATLVGSDHAHRLAPGSSLGPQQRRCSAMGATSRSDMSRISHVQCATESRTPWRRPQSPPPTREAARSANKSAGDAGPQAAGARDSISPGAAPTNGCLTTPPSVLNAGRRCRHQETPTHSRSARARIPTDADRGGPANGVSGASPTRSTCW